MDQTSDLNNLALNVLQITNVPLSVVPDKVVFFVKRIRKLLNQAETANKKVTHYVSNDFNLYYPDVGNKKSVDTLG